MIHEKKTKIFAMLTYLLLVVLILNSCGISDLTNGSREEMDNLLVRVMNCIETGDVDTLAEICVEPDRVRQIFPEIQSYWPARGDDSYTCKEYTIHVGKDYKIISAVYIVESQNEEYQVSIEARLNGEAPVIQGLNVISEEDLEGKDETI